MAGVDGDRAARPPAGGQESASNEQADEGEDEGPLPLLPRGRRVDKPVARLFRTIDCAWSGDYIPEAGDGLAAGDKLSLESGLAEIVFQDGARAILQGPGKLDVRSRAAAYLERGKCAVSVDRARVKGFQIDTRGMKYTDLGTEFGVLVAATGEQEVHVFRGTVRVEQGDELGAGSREQNNLPSPSGRGAGGEGGSGSPLPDHRYMVPARSPLILAANQAIRVAAPDASGKHDKPIERVVANQRQFVRALPPATGLDLVDIVAGGDGLSTRRNREINPTNGRFGDEPGGHDNIDPGVGSVFRADHQYHRVPGSPLIDGVFIVHGGRGPVQLDSAGHSFAGFPHNDGKTANMIQAVGATPVRPRAWFTAKQNNLPQLGGVDYSSIGHGVLAIRSNKGITFDLAAIRAAHPGYRLLSLAAVAGNSCRANSGSSLGNFWVFVDGQLRFQQRNVSVNTGAIPLDISLQPTDRYLTLVATTATPGGIWNGTMFGDPKLKLAAIDRSPADANKAE